MSAVAQYATPKKVNDLEDCFFYHTMSLPSVGLVKGMWDLREGVQDYLGHVDFRDKTVLELGPASGFLSFYMEKQGSRVVSYDLSEEQAWDVVPYAGLDLQHIIDDRKEHIRRLNNSFWYAHSELKSGVKVLYGSVYSITQDVGPFNIAVVGSILLHLRDPFLALEKTLARTTDTVVVTDMLSRYLFFPRLWFSAFLPKQLRRPKAHFIPDYTERKPLDTWWRLNPQIIQSFLGVLGFEDSKVTYHRQPLNGKSLPLFTVVAHRTRGKVT